MGKQRFTAILKKVKKNGWLQGMYWGAAGVNCLLTSLPLEQAQARIWLAIGVILLLVTPVIMLDHRPESHDKFSVVSAAASWIFLSGMCVFEAAGSWVSFVIMIEVVSIFAIRGFFGKKKK